MSQQSTVVVGLLPSQVRRVADEFPKSGLKFIPRDREGELHVLAKSFDNVVVMTKFISHSTWFLIPREKVRPVNGGLTALKRMLRSLLTPASATETRPSLKEPYMPPAIDYSALKNAAPGEVVKISRPPTVTNKTFQKQVNAMRSYYRRNHAIETTLRSLDDHVEIFVVSRGGVTAKEGEPAKTAAVLPDDSNVKQLWSEAYLRLISSLPGCTDDVYASRADAAVAAYLQRFPS